MSKIFSSSI